MIACRVGWYTELFYAIISTVGLFRCFLLICYPYILLHFYQGLSTTKFRHSHALCALWVQPLTSPCLSLKGHCRDKN